MKTLRSCALLFLIASSVWTSDPLVNAQTFCTATTTACKNSCTDTSGIPGCFVLCAQQCFTATNNGYPTPGNVNNPTDSCGNDVDNCPPPGPSAKIDRGCQCSNYCENPGCTPGHQSSACPSGTEPGTTDGCGCHKCVPSGGQCKEIDVSCEEDTECCSEICNDQTYLCADSESPILVDVAGNGFSLTDVADGVLFDLRPGGSPELVSWTRPGSDDAWLALDRNGNGTIDDGTELFGNFTPQPASAKPNGFVALATFDQNSDGWIDSADSVYPQLWLWTDSNHDGVSQAGELRTLAAAGLLRISLDVKESGRRDRIGNRYRYRAKIVTANPRGFGPYAYDVFLVVSSSTTQSQSVIQPPWLRRGHGN